MADNEQTNIQSTVLVDSSGKPVVDSQGDQVHTRDVLEIENPDYQFDPNGMTQDKQAIDVSESPRYFANKFENDRAASAVVESSAILMDEGAKSLDRNGDGKVTMEEFKQVDKLRSEMFESERTDGRVTWDEFRGNVDRMQEERRITSEEMDGILTSAAMNEFKDAKTIIKPRSLSSVVEDGDKRVDLYALPDDTLFIPDTKEFGRELRALKPTVEAGVAEVKGMQFVEPENTNSVMFNEANVNDLISRLKSGKPVDIDVSKYHVDNGTTVTPSSGQAQQELVSRTR